MIIGGTSERFDTSLLASLSLAHITADKQFAFGSPEPTPWASFIRKSLGERDGGDYERSA